MQHTILRAFLLAFLLAGCLAGCLAGGSASGAVNGIEFHMTRHRPLVTGGDEHSIAIHMHRGDAERGTLFVDGVDFGEVRSGDDVRVTGDAAVLVNGERRSPSAR